MNIYSIPTDPDLTAAEVEKEYLEFVKAVKSEITIPVAVKLSPFFTNFANVAKRLVVAGADGLVLFNRFYQPDIDLEHARSDAEHFVQHADGDAPAACAGWPSCMAA